MEHSTIPSCEATGPDGTRILIRPHATTDSIADLARALDLPATSGLTIDGRSVASHEPLVAAGLRVGSVIGHEPIDPEPLHVDSSVGGVEVAVLVGPACERWVRLGPGRHRVGRAPTAAVRVDDPGVELHHGVLDVAADGSARFIQLTGMFPATIDGAPCDPTRSLEPGCSLSLGTSRLAIGRFPRRGETTPPTSEVVRNVGGSIVAVDRDPWRSMVRRAPSPSNDTLDVLLDVPEPPGTHRAPPLTSLVGAGVAAAGAGLLAAVLGQLLFAVFAAVGAVAAIATWAVGALLARRDRRRAVAAHRAALVVFEKTLHRAHLAAERQHRAQHRDLVDALGVIHGDGTGIWSQRCMPHDALWSTIGRGTCRWNPPITADARGHLDADLLVSLERSERLDDVAVPLGLEPGSVVALHGSPTSTEALARSVIVQLAATYGPADWQLQVVTDHPERWHWARWLPHVRDRHGVVAADDPQAVAAAMDAGGDRAGRRMVIVVDAPALLSARTGPVRRRLERGDVSCLALVGSDTSVPAVADRILDVGGTGAAAWAGSDARAWTAVDCEITMAGLSVATAEVAARQLAPLIDPEDHDEADGLPTGVSLAELEPVGDDSAAIIARRWQHAGPDPAPVARLGVSGDGIIDIDLVRDGPHGLVAGTTGAGKSELLRTLVVSLAAQSSPDHVTMVLVDFKGGSTFDACERLPHTVGVVTDLDDGLAERVLESLDAEVRRRERLLRAARVDDLSGYRRAATDPLPRLVVVIDEFASLAKELPGFLGALVAVAQRGRSLGIHLLLATQRPAGVVTDDIRANTNLRIALRLQDRSDADDVVGDEAPARFPVGLPGRATLRLGPDDLVVFQTASSAGALPRGAGRLQVEVIEADVTGSGGPGADASEVDAQRSVLDHLVDAIGVAAGMVEVASPHRPWIDPLPDVVHPRDLADGPMVVGVLDDPAGQCRRPLTWTPSEGNLLLVGAVGAGTTTAAGALMAACARASPTDELHLYVVDAQGDTAWSECQSLAQCGAVVRATEVERLTRLLARLASELDRRVTDGGREPTVVVAIDGYAAVRDALADVAHTEAAARLSRVLRDGPAVGIVSVVTTDGASSTGLAVPRSATWVFHVGDPGSARTAGLRGPVVAPGRPGRLRVVESAMEGQVVLDPQPFRVDAVADTSEVGAPSVEVLPDVVDSDVFDARLSAAGAADSGDGEPAELAIGIGADDLQPQRLRVPVGDHVFIGGAARTGRTTALHQVEAAWRRLHPDGRVIRIDRRRCAGAGAAADFDDLDTPALVVVDDAERIDDLDGTLVRLMGQERVMFAIAARLEAVRVAYGHWTREVARGRCGLIMTSMGDVDGELLGATLPRRTPMPPRPGLAWMVDQAGHRLVQVAARMPP